METQYDHLMTCKYCLLFELGHCRKIHPYPKDKEPRYLRLRTGKFWNSISIVPTAK